MKKPRELEEVDAARRLELDRSLRNIDVGIYEAEREDLEVNRPGRKVPYYQFVPSHHHPDPV